MSCTHQDHSFKSDLFIILAVVLGFFGLREGLAWLWKTNHIHSELRALREDVRALRKPI